MAITKLAGRGIKILTAGQEMDVRVDGKERKSFAVSNLSTSGSGKNLYIADETGNPALVAFPGLPVGLEAGETFKIQNPHATESITFVLGEVQFTGSGQPGGAQALGGGGGGGGGLGGDGDGSPGSFGGRYQQP